MLPPDQCLCRNNLFCLCIHNRLIIDFQMAILDSFFQLAGDLSLVYISTLHRIIVDHVRFDILIRNITFCQSRTVQHPGNSHRLFFYEEDSAFSRKAHTLSILEKTLFTHVSQYFIIQILFPNQAGKMIRFHSGCQQRIQLGMRQHVISFL